MRIADLIDAGMNQNGAAWRELGVDIEITDDHPSEIVVYGKYFDRYVVQLFEKAGWGESIVVSVTTTETGTLKIKFGAILPVPACKTSAPAAQKDSE